MYNFPFNAGIWLSFVSQTGLLCVMALPFANAKDKLQVDIIAIGGKTTANYAQLTYLGPPMSVAVDYVNKLYNESLNVTLISLYDDLPWTLMVSQWYYRQRDPRRLSMIAIASGIVAPDVTYMFQQWNILFNSVTTMTPAINNRAKNPTWISTARMNYPALSVLFCEVLLKYNWTTFMTVLDVASAGIYSLQWVSIVDDAVTFIGHAPLQRQVNVTSTFDFGPLLSDIRARTRVVIFFGSGGAARNFLIAAAKSNMTNGEYVYMAMEIMDNPKMYGRMHWKYNDSYDSIAYRAFQSLLIMRSADVYAPIQKDLAEKMMAYTRRDFNITYRIQDMPFQNMLCGYSAVTALAEVLNNLWTDGQNHPYHDGKYLATQFLNRTFQNNVSQVYIDSKGGRQLDFYVWRFDENGEHKKFLYKNAVTNAPIVELYGITRWANGSWPPLNEPVCGFTNNRAVCSPEERGSLIVALSVTAVTVFCLITVGCGICMVRRANKRTLQTWWRIDQSELTFGRDPAQFAVSFNSAMERRSRTIENRTQYLTEKFFPAKLKGLEVLIEVIQTFNEQTLLEHAGSSRPFLLDINKLRNLAHPNISRLYGVSLLHSAVKSGIAVITERTGRGCIYDVFEGLTLLDMALTSSLMNDFLAGMQFVHTSLWGYHGCLNGFYCHVDKHFTLKVNGLLNARLLEVALTRSNQFRRNAKSSSARNGFWVKGRAFTAGPLQKADIYAVGVVLWELLSRQRFLSIENTHNIEQIGSAEQDRTQEFQGILALCWKEVPEERPPIKEIRELLATKSSMFSFRRAGTKFMDEVLRRIEGYTNELENEVSLRTENLVDELEKCNEIIAQLLPRWVANQIRSGKPVSAEMFECATVMFTQICGFETLIGCNSPAVVIDVIDEAETLIDRSIGSFSDEIYKVEVVDGSFLLVGGLPLRNGTRHAQVMAGMAIRILQLTPLLFGKFDLQFKSGIHSGPCAAGIVGIRRLRYCLFGDTVNTAARMCSSGTPNRTQMSQSTASILSKSRIVRFELECRGVISVKGKDDMTTFWLNGYSGTPN